MPTPCIIPSALYHPGVILLLGSRRHVGQLPNFPHSAAISLTATVRPVATTSSSASSAATPGPLPCPLHPSASTGSRSRAVIVPVSGTSHQAGRRPPPPSSALTPSGPSNSRHLVLPPSAISRQPQVATATTEDVLFMDSGDPWKPRPETVEKVMAMLEGIHRVLKSDGTYISISFGQIKR